MAGKRYSSHGGQVMAAGCSNECRQQQAREEETLESGAAPTRLLAEYCATLRYEDLPRDVVEKAKACVLDSRREQLVAASGWSNASMNGNRRFRFASR